MRHLPCARQTAYVTKGVQLDFSNQANAYHDLTTYGVTGSDDVTNCGSARMVVANSPATSYFVAVLMQSYEAGFVQATGCTPYTAHYQDQNISAAEQSSIVQWINAGAPNN